MQADHVIPRSAGGTDDLSNLKACCANCNKTANGYIFKSFKEKRKYILQARKEKRPKGRRFLKILGGRK